MKSFASAHWQGSGKEGSGTLSTKSQVLNKVAYETESRFVGGKNTNPEELIGAAHAGCFSMKLSFLLGAAGFTPASIDTEATITLEAGSVTSSHLVIKASVPGITPEKFLECADDAKANCPISKLLNTKITMEATLG